MVITANDYQSGSFRPDHDHEETPPVEAKGEIAVAVAVEVAVEVAVAAGSESSASVSAAAAAVSLSPSPSPSPYVDIHEDENRAIIIDFFPPLSANHEWMGRSIESLVLGHRATASILEDRLLVSSNNPDDDDDDDDDYYCCCEDNSHSLDTTNDWNSTFGRRRSTMSTLGGRRGSSNRNDSLGLV